MEYIRKYASPLGEITLAATEEGLTGLWFAGQKQFPAQPRQEMTGTVPALDSAVRWLNIYFSGGTPDFTPPLACPGTAFQSAVWKLLLEIPYGETVTYGALAARMGKKMSAQAVGGAVGRNPISLIIPCHRVVGANGSLTGYAGGLDKKEWLLTWEGKNL